MVNPLMPKGTAMWLLENTSLTFEQIANFCKLHALEIESMANDEAGSAVPSSNPILNGQLTQDEIDRCVLDPELALEMARAISKTKKRAKYTPIAQRQDKPNAIMWLLKNHPELSVQQIIRLIGTTKSTIESIRGRTHWNIQNIKPQNPIILSFCMKSDLNEAIAKANAPKSPKTNRTKKRAKKKVDTIKIVATPEKK